MLRRSQQGTTDGDPLRRISKAFPLTPLEQINIKSSYEATSPSATYAPRCVCAGVSVSGSGCVCMCQCPCRCQTDLRLWQRVDGRRERRRCGGRRPAAAAAADTAQGAGPRQRRPVRHERLLVGDGRLVGQLAENTAEI